MKAAVQAVVGRLMAAVTLAGLGSAQAWAADPKNYQLGFAEPVAPDAVEQILFHDRVLMPVVVITTLLVLALLLYACFRFSEKRNPVPSKTTHNALIEVIWTLVPILILVVLVFPSMRVLYASDDVSDAQMTVKVTGHQWYWRYDYPDHGEFGFESMIAARTHEEAERLGVKRLMDVDNPMVVPTGVEVRLILTAADVLHNWAVSELGVRMDTVPGRINEESFLIPEGKEGVYYGFCSELCGMDHAFMPIVVRAVSQADFERWTEESKERFAAVGQPQGQSPGQSNNAVLFARLDR